MCLELWDVYLWRPLLLGSSVITSYYGYAQVGIAIIWLSQLHDMTLCLLLVHVTIIFVNEVYLFYLILLMIVAIHILFPNDEIFFIFQGSISVSMSVFQTLFCFICTHLTSGEKEAEAIKRNSDVHEIHRRTHFNSFSSIRLPKSIHDHEWVHGIRYDFQLDLFFFILPTYGLTLPLFLSLW